MRNVYSWFQAINDGYNPNEYSHVGVPVGTYRATLDFKIWAKKVSAITCYFTIKENEKKFKKWYSETGEEMKNMYWITLILILLNVL